MNLASVSAPRVKPVVAAGAGLPQMALGSVALVMSPPEIEPKLAPLTINCGATWLSPTGAPRRWP